jgi:hypothetical protein
MDVMGLKRVNRIIKRLPIVGGIGKGVLRLYRAVLFPGSGSYWESRYAAGDTSGRGSYSKLADFKAELLNSFVRTNHVSSVIEFGCGDGNQLSLAVYPSYIGVDVSKTAIKICGKRFSGDPSKSFYFYDPECFFDNAGLFHADLALSLDVIYHLVEDDVFARYLKDLFKSAERFVIIYASNTNENSPDQPPHVRHRAFTDWIEVNIKGWGLKEKIENKYPFQGSDVTGSFSDFYVYEKSK